MYILLKQGVILEIFEQYADLVRTYALREASPQASDEAGDVLKDAMLERAIWSHPNSWAQAKKFRDRTGFSLFRVGFGKIRQNVIRSGGKRGWKEICPKPRESPQRVE